MPSIKQLSEFLSQKSITATVISMTTIIIRVFIFHNSVMFSIFDGSSDYEYFEITRQGIIIHSELYATATFWN